MQIPQTGNDPWGPVITGRAWDLARFGNYGRGMKIPQPGNDLFGRYVLETHRLQLLPLSGGWRAVNVIIVGQAKHIYRHCPPTLSMSGLNWQVRLATRIKQNPSGCISALCLFAMYTILVIFNRERWMYLMYDRGNVCTENPRLHYQCQVSFGRYDRFV